MNGSAVLAPACPQYACGRRRCTRMSDATSDERDVPCLQCGYSLRGLPIVHRCPECGYPTVDSRLRFDSRPRSMFFWLSALIVGWLTGAIMLSGPRGSRHPSISRAQVAQAEVQAIAQQVQMYLLDNGLTTVPNGFTLNALAQSSTPYVMTGDLIDPWGNPYLIEIDARNPAMYRIVSRGADGTVGGRKDAADLRSDVSHVHVWTSSFTVLKPSMSATR